MTSPFTPEHVAEWASFGPKPPKGKPTPEQQVLLTERKKKCKEMTSRLVGELSNPAWTEKKIQIELDRLVEEADKDVVERPEYLNGPSGTRDFYPADMKVQNWLFDNFREAARTFGFQEYDAPVLENVQLYERKAGEEIVDQMYNFVDKENNHVTLRPEMTPTLARLVLNKTNLQTGEVRLTLPLKWFSIPQCWRFETTQRGRKREHYQWNMDIVGVDHVHAELELLAAACFFFRRVGIGSDIVGIKVNSRAVLEAVLAKHGVNKGEKDPKDGGDLFSKACVIIDKLDKIGGPAVTQDLAGIGVSAESAAEILKALEAPTVEALAEHIGEESEAINEVKRLFVLAKDYGIDDYLIFDASVVRGLAYYTGVVWEAFDRRGELRAIMGGGRYDRLLELYGGEKCQIPCVGFGFGDCVIMELLKECGKLPEFQGSGVDYVVCAFSPDLYGAAADISSKLRACGWSVDLMPTPKKKVAASFKHADQAGARRMVFVAPDEIEKGVVRIKDLRTKDKNGNAVQVDCPLDEIHTIDDLVANAAAN
jgi:histidyl-tRNA synthetase